MTRDKATLPPAKARATQAELKDLLREVLSKMRR